VIRFSWRKGDGKTKFSRSGLLRAFAVDLPAVLALWRFNPTAGTYGATGMRKEKMAPAPGLLEAQIEPPCRWMISRLM
jgi:hypothetical protein